MDLLSLALVSAGVSALVQVAKKYFKLPGDALVILLSLLAGLVYFLFQDSDLWKNFLEILVVSNTIFGLLVKRFE